MSGTNSIYSGPAGTGGLRAGAVSATIDGEVVDVVGDASYDATTVNRETLTGQSGVQGFSEMPKAGFISFKLRDAGSLTVSQIKTKTSSSVILILVNGKSVYGDGLWCTECSEVNTQDGTFTVKFEGNVSEEPA